MRKKRNRVRPVSIGKRGNSATRVVFQPITLFKRGCLGVRGCTGKPTLESWCGNTRVRCCEKQECKRAAARRARADSAIWRKAKS